MTVARVEQLFALAASTTHEEEARTAAIAGVRLMKRLGLRIVEKGKASSRQETRPRQPSEPPPAKAPPRGTWKTARGSRRCAGCGQYIEDGERFYEDETLFAWCQYH